MKINQSGCVVYINQAEWGPKVSRKNRVKAGACVRASERQVIDVLAPPRHPDSLQPPPGAVKQKLSF